MNNEKSVFQHNYVLCRNEKIVIDKSFPGDVGDCIVNLDGYLIVPIENIRGFEDYRKGDNLDNRLVNLKQITVDLRRYHTHDYQTISEDKNLSEI